MRRLETKRENLTKQITPEIKMKMEEEAEELLSTMHNEMANDLKEYGEFILGLDLKKTLAECETELKTNKTKTSCNKFEEQNKFAEMIERNLANRTTARLSVATTKVEEHLKSKYPNNYHTYKKLKDVEQKIDSVLKNMAKNQ